MRKKCHKVDGAIQNNKCCKIRETKGVLRFLLGLWGWCWFWMWGSVPSEEWIFQGFSSNEMAWFDLVKGTLGTFRINVIWNLMFLGPRGD